MPWVVGIDEAGYGPNLGPFVMSAVACQAPDEWLGSDWWHHLADVVRRHDDPKDGDRLLIDDSKQVYSGDGDLTRLESGVLAALGNGQLKCEATVDDLVNEASPANAAELRNEAWYSGRTKLPTAANHDDCQRLAERFHQRKGTVTWQPVCSSIINAGRFNVIADAAGSKGAVLEHCLAQLLRSVPDDDEPIHFFIDKHGGRNYYAAMLQDAFADGMVVAREESSRRSVYQVLGVNRSVTFTFEPRADSVHLCVALASMASKYLRELLMMEFNQFWQTHVPKLKPTAGYPTDAPRFYQAIKPAIVKLGLKKEQLWRNR